jgi:hypothetical protein
MAAYISFYDYVVWRTERFPDEAKGENGVELLKAAMDGGFDDSTVDRSVKTTNYLLQLGISPNSTCNLSYFCGRSLWAEHLLRLCEFPLGDPWFWKITEAFLQFGALEPRWAREDPQQVGEYEKIIVLYLGDQSFILDETFPTLSKGHGWPLRRVPHALDNPAGKATLYDFLEMDVPDNAYAIRMILDRKLQLVEPTTDEVINEMPEKDVEHQDMIKTECVDTSPSKAPYTKELMEDSRKINLNEIRVAIVNATKNPLLPWAILGTYSVTRCISLSLTFVKVF